MIQVYALWFSCEGIGLSADDSRERISHYLMRNPGMSSVAIDDGVVVAAVLVGDDGRRGFMHHLAVAESHRGKGIGKALVNRSLDKLSAISISKCHIFVFDNNHQGIDFWSHEGWKLREDLSIMSKNVLEVSKDVAPLCVPSCNCMMTSR